MITDAVLQSAMNSNRPISNIPQHHRAGILYWYCRKFHNLTGPYQDDQGLYERCLDCGRRLAWVDPLPLADPTRRERSRGTLT